jgi:hypothetical protein
MTLLALQRQYAEAIHRIYHGDKPPTMKDWRRYEKLKCECEERFDAIIAARVARGRPRCKYDDEPVKRVEPVFTQKQGSLFHDV